MKILEFKFVSVIGVVLVGVVLVAMAFALSGTVEAAEECFEGREGGATTVTKTEIGVDLYNVKCSPTTGGVLWWGDPFDGTIPMEGMPEDIEADYLTEPAVVKPRIDKLQFYPCSNCHGAFVPIPRSDKPRMITSPMYPHETYAPRDPKDLEHGKGAIWCLDCHSAKNRDVLISHRGEPISFNAPQKLCGKCHGQIYRDWRDGIHGKRIGYLKKGGKKRWWVCTECHNPHDVEPAFAPLDPEPAPALPKGMDSAEHEREGHH